MGIAIRSDLPALVLALAGLTAACRNEPATAPTPVPSGKAEDEPSAGSAYGADGSALRCEVPRRDCPKRERNLEFLDACRMAGYRVRTCGCEEACTGRINLDKPHYDANGNAKSCAPEQADCTPAETSAAFQDACNERGFKLVLCGCEWLCAGNVAE